LASVFWCIGRSCRQRWSALLGWDHGCERGIQQHGRCGRLGRITGRHGALLTSYYANWANQLASFARTTSDSGVPLLALSAQNEPNWTAEWETCRWTDAELLTFVRDYLGPALASQNLATTILAPETIDWTSLQAYGDRLLADATARGYIGILASHAYGGTAFNYAAPSENAKEFWETEVSDQGAYDTGMGSAIRVARTIHEHLTVAQVNAWHYWWLLPRTDVATTDNASLVVGG
jgi:glucuronoarabinoxylan endo-1,4-beta-xylanase